LRLYKNDRKNQKKRISVKTPKIIIGILVSIIAANAYSQCRHALKFETGYLYYLDHTITIDSEDPDWKGYKLNGRQNGIDFNIINGISFREHYMAGIGLGYLNFEGIHGAAVFADLEYAPLKRKISPVLNIKAGYNHIWNQYETGSGSALGEIGAGIKYKVTDNISVHIQAGVLRTQQAQFFPLRLGLGFWKHPAF
jgi:hypothetical protein